MWVTRPITIAVSPSPDKSSIRSHLHSSVRKLSAMRGDGHSPRRLFDEAAHGELILRWPVVLNRPDQRIIIALGEEVYTERPIPPEILIGVRMLAQAGQDGEEAALIPPESSSRSGS
mgnify:CR=1 FL=1